MESLEGRTWEKFSCTVEYESGKWHLSPESVLHEMGFRIFSPAIKSVYPYISSAFFSHYFRVSGRFCERWPIIRIPLSHGAGGSLRQHAAWYDSRYVDGRMTCGYALPRLRLRAQRASSGNAGSPMSVEVVTSRNVISPSDFQTAMDLKYVRDVKEAPRKVTHVLPRRAFNRRGTAHTGGKNAVVWPLHGHAGRRHDRRYCRTVCQKMQERGFRRRQQ